MGAAMKPVDLTRTRDAQLDYPPCFETPLRVCHTSNSACIPSQSWPSALWEMLLIATSVGSFQISQGDGNEVIQKMIV